mmetsp:Transcript_33131/g.39673  ORF Transcript_33131/g.39673 Transcript_33131/m.39673 type:complete len:128 (-) Transcript_33131:36-419(-)
MSIATAGICGRFDGGGGVSSWFVVRADKRTILQGFFLPLVVHSLDVFRPISSSGDNDGRKGFLTYQSRLLVVPWDGVWNLGESNDLNADASLNSCNSMNPTKICITQNRRRRPYYYYFVITMGAVHK